MPAPPAFLLTWTTYGTRLPGDPRRSVVEDNRPGAPLARPRPGLEKDSRSRLRHEPVRLDNFARGVIRETVLDHCEIRRWSLHAEAIRSNHVHLVLSGDATPENMMTQLKAWTTRRLRERGCFDAGARVWTKHGSTRYLNSLPSFEGAVRYVRDGQGAPLD